jgi:hypothetical protein
LDNLSKDLISMMNSNYTTSDLEYFKRGLLKSSDFNKDGSINKSELKVLLLTFISSKY